MTMNGGGIGARGWLIALAGAAVVAGLVVVLFRAPPPVAGARLVAPKERAEAVGIEKLGENAGNALLREEAMLRDPTPLFLPTRWNAGETALSIEAGREPGSSFQGYPSKPQFPEVELTLAFPAPVAVPERTADAFAMEKATRPFRGFGEVARPVVPLAARAAFVEVSSAGDGRLLLAQPLTEAHPPGGVVWQPLEFLVAVEPSGVVRPPVLVESSRAGAVDGYFQDFLVNAFHIGERLAPGFYRVCIGP